MIAQSGLGKNGSSAKPEVRPILEPLLIGVKELAPLLGISEPTLERWRASGRLGLPGIKMGGRRLWPMAEIREWVESGMPDRETWLALRKANGKRL